MGLIKYFFSWTTKKSGTGETPSKFGLVQIFGFIIAFAIFVIMIILWITGVPYDPNAESPYISAIFHTFLPLYAATATLLVDPQRNKYTTGSIILVFLGVILGVILLGLSFIAGDWGTTMLSLSLELIMVTGTGLGIGVSNRIPNQ